MGWVIWNSLKKEYQFPSINETSSLAAGKKLVSKIGNDAAKYRFKIVNKEQFEAKKEKGRIGLGTKLWFGKYKGKTLEAALKENPGYLEWLLKNTKYEFEKGVKMAILIFLALFFLIGPVEAFILTGIYLMGGFGMLLVAFVIFFIFRGWVF